MMMGVPGMIMMLMITTVATFATIMMVVMTIPVRMIVMIVAAVDLHFSVQHIEQSQNKQPKPRDRCLHAKSSITTQEVIDTT